MPIAQASIRRSANRGPLVLVYEVDGAVQDVQVSLASINAAIDAAKTLIAALPGSITHIRINVQSTD